MELIDKDELLKATETVDYYERYEPYEVDDEYFEGVVDGLNAYYRVREAIRNAPVLFREELKVGKWVNFHNCAKCSNCTLIVKTMDIAKEWNFCPNCGARMTE